MLKPVLDAINGLRADIRALSYQMKQLRLSIDRFTELTNVTIEDFDDGSFPGPEDQWYR